jgi:hypothetical protein
MTAVPVPAFAECKWFLALYWQTGDVGDIVPIQCVQRPPPVFNQSVLPDL